MKKLYVLFNDCAHDFMSNNFYVYQLEDNHNNIFYVGKGRDNRGWKHISLRSNQRIVNTNKHLYNKINKIIETEGLLVVRLTATFDTELAAFNHEQQLISSKGRLCDAKGPLLNITKGGEGHTSDGIPVCQYTLWGDFVKEYPNAKEAARVNGWKHYGTICGCCKGRERSYKGFLWSYKDQIPTLLTKNKVIYQWSLMGEYEDVHKNATAAARKMGCDPSTITDCVTGHIRQAVGFQWTTDKNSPGKVRNSRRRKQVRWINTSQAFESVTAAAAASRHNIGYVSACCRGKRSSIGLDRFEYI